MRYVCQNQVFRQIVYYLAELFRQIVCYLAELFRQIAFPIIIGKSFFSIQHSSSIKTYIDCAWVTTQIIDGHSFRVPTNPDLVIGYLVQVSNTKYHQVERETLDNMADIVSQ